MKNKTGKSKKGFNFKKLSINDTLKNGALIKGYTYNIGDYHNDRSKFSKEHLGDKKLRVGIIIEAISNQFFKVQYRNSAALKKENQKWTNKITYTFPSNPNKKYKLCGVDSYCQLVQREQILSVNQEEIIISGNFKEIQDSISSKHSKEKREAIKYLQSGEYQGLPQDQIDEVFEEKQFTKQENKMSHKEAWDKVSLLYERHLAKDCKCVDNEYKKIKNVKKFLNEEKMTTTDKNLYQEFLESSFNEYQKANLSKNQEAEISEPEEEDEDQLELEM